MEDVSDPPFRALCKREGADVMYTEFISVEGLIRDARKSVEKLDIYPEERPIGVQIFGAELDSMLKASDIVEEAGPEILDINFGCPVKKVVCKMAGAGHPPGHPPDGEPHRSHRQALQPAGDGQDASRVGRLDH